MTLETTLPEGFSALEPFVPLWALPKSADRAAQRLATTTKERADFFETAKDLMPAAMAHLDQFPLSALPAPEQRLMDVMLSLAHISLAVELQGPDEQKSAKWRERMRITRATSDLAAAQ